MVEAKQYGERVNIVKYIRVEKKWRFAAVVEKRGRVIRDQVWIARRKEHHPEGRYFLEWYQAGKRRRHSVGGFENVIDGARRKAIDWGLSKQVSFVPKRNLRATTGAASASPRRSIRILIS